MLSEEQLKSDPFDQFREWYDEAIASNMTDPNAMILATCGANKRPSSRIVLLKEVANDGFTFFTNYHSKKGCQIEENPLGSLLFPWHSVERQVRIEGIIVKISPAKSDEYFNNRSEGSRIGAWTSPQSQEIPSREFLEIMEEKYKNAFKADTLPRPPHWGGYKLLPDLFEFWQGRENRLHDRFEYYKKKGFWKIRRLAP
jgi:pyridoxamine 5'-phosphate oxidase